MVAGFNRSFSLPGSPCSKTRPVSNKPYHVRSVSLTCRSHPLVSQLEEEIRSVSSWVSSQPLPESASWTCDGLSRLELLHMSLNDLLSLPQNQDSLRRGSGSEWTDRILDDFLRFADAYDILRSDVATMNERIAEAEMSIRRDESVKLTSVARSMKKNERNLIKLASSLRDISKSSTTVKTLANGIEEAELAGIVGDAINVTVSASVTVLSRMAALSSSMTESLKHLVGKSDCRKRNVMERLEDFEECTGAVESRCERLFRCVVNTRVCVLNALTH